MELAPGDLAGFARLLLTKLGTETEPKNLPQRETIEDALNRFVTADTIYQETLRGRKEAFSIMQAEKRNWTRGMAKTEALAESSCYFEQAYLRSIFAPAKWHRRSAAEAPAVAGEGVEDASAEGVPGPQAVNANEFWPCERSDCLTGARHGNSFGRAGV